MDDPLAELCYDELPRLKGIYLLNAVFLVEEARCQ